MSRAADSSTLSFQALAGQGEYKALAALVYHADMEDALGALAASARDPEALRWVVALLARKLSPEGYQPHEQATLEAYVQQLDDNLPGDLRVPEFLREGVEEFILTTPTPALQPWPRAEKQLVAQAAAQMTLDTLLEFGRWAYGRIDAALLSPVLNQVAAQAHSPYDPEIHSKCGRALSEFALRTSAPEVAQTLAARSSPGDLAALPQSLVSSAVRAQRLGRVCASILGQGEEDLSEDVVRWLERLTEDAYREALLVGIDDQTQDLGLNFDLELLGPCVLGYPRAARTLCRMDGGDAALGAAEESDDPEGQMLWVAEAAVEELDEAALETVAERCTWRSLTGEQYRRLIASYSRQPEALLDEAARALDSLDLPEAEAIPPRLLQELLGAALEHPVDELTQRLDQEPTHYLQQILDLRGRALHQRALELAENLPPDEDLVELLASRRDTMHGLAEPFRRILGAHAQELVATASDTSLEAGQRVQALTLASRAEPTVARETAFELCKANSALIRRAAAEVLAATRSAAEDEMRLRALLEDESDNLTHSRLQAAIRNVSSGDVEEAIRNLWQLVGSTPDGNSTAEVLLPVSWRHNTFIECVDRRRSGGEPSGYIDSLITLSELIVETALIARYEATGDPVQSLRPKEVELVRANDPAKPDAGDLVNRQQLLQRGFGWFHQVASLRELRSVHPERTRSANPQPVTQADVPVAEGLFREMLSGWRNSMLETRRLAQQSSQPTA